VQPEQQASTEDTPIPVRLTTWPVDRGQFGLDALFQGCEGYRRARAHRARLEEEGVPQVLRRELDGAWTLRFGPLPATDVAPALAAFVY
jgi:hypothetical protein